MRDKIFAYTGLLLVAFSTVYIVFEVPRTDFWSLISFYTIGFGGMVLSYKYASPKDLFVLLFGGLIVRFLLINVTPELSNDFYRFIWDGEMMKLGLLPYVKTPDEIISSSPEIFQNAELRALYHGMGELSSGNHSNYPPINEFLFFIAAKLGSTLSAKVMILRIFTILADIGIVFVGLSLLKMKEMDLKKILFFVLNPFFILEFTANLHFEGVMMCFFLIAFWLYLKELKLLSGLFFAFSILTKMMTMIFLPFFLRKGNWKKGLIYIGSVALFTVIFAYPFFMNAGWEGYNSANSLYFKQLEFNAGLYFAFNGIVSAIAGFNAIQYIGPLFAFMALCGILVWYYKKQDKPLLEGFELWTIAFFIYLLMSTTVHPWYIGVLVLVGLFTNYLFPIVWSFLAYLSYYFYAENMSEGLFYTFVVVEYLVVIGVAVYEVKSKKVKVKSAGVDV